MVILGIVLLVVGYVLPLPVLITVGWILVVVGAVLWILGAGGGGGGGAPPPEICEQKTAPPGTPPAPINRNKHPTPPAAQRK